MIMEFIYNSHMITFNLSPVFFFNKFSDHFFTITNDVRKTAPIKSSDYSTHYRNPANMPFQMFLDNEIWGYLSSNLNAILKMYQCVYVGNCMSRSRASL